MSFNQIEMKNNFQYPQQQDENYKNQDDINDEFSNIIREINSEQIQVKNPQHRIKQNHQNKNSENKNKRLNKFQITNLADENQDFTTGQKYFLNKQTSQIGDYFEQINKLTALIRERLSARIDKNDTTINQIQQQIQSEQIRDLNAVGNNNQSNNQRIERQGNNNQMQTSNQQQGVNQQTNSQNFVSINKNFYCYFMILGIVSINSIIILSVCLGAYIGQLKDKQNNLETHLNNLQKIQEQQERLVLQQNTSIYQNLSNLTELQNKTSAMNSTINQVINNLQTQINITQSSQRNLTFNNNYINQNCYKKKCTCTNSCQCNNISYEFILSGGCQGWNCGGGNLLSFCNPDYLNYYTWIGWGIDVGSIIQGNANTPRGVDIIITCCK